MAVDRVRRLVIGGCASASLLAAWRGPRAASAGAAAPAPAAPAPVAEPAPGAAAAAMLEEPLFAAPTTLDRVGRVLAPVRINGQGPFRFIVDTGATHSALSPALVAGLGLVAGSGAPVRMQGVTGSAVVPTVKVARLEAGALRLRNLEMPMIEPRVFAQADGILGIEGMAGNRLDIDFLHDRVTITRSRGEPAPRGWMVVPARHRRRGVLIVEARVGRVRGLALVDTGAERTLGNLLLQRRLALDAASTGERLPPTQVYGATDAVQEGESLRAPRIVVGDATLTNLEITFADLHVFRYFDLDSGPALLIGMDMLGVVARLVIDYRRHELQVRERR
jgi:predicted aspartyl protease